MMQDGARILLFSFFLLLSLWNLSEAEQSLKAAILISKDIKPYFEAADGIQRFFGQETKIGSEIFSLEKSNVIDDLNDKLIKKEISLIIVIGPQALELADTQHLTAKIPVIYTLILNPEKKVGDIKNYCGIPFSVPIRLQLRYIAKSLPDIKKLGVLYDPKYNEEFFKQASEIAKHHNLKLESLNVSSPKEITPILDQKLSDIDALWLIPDKFLDSDRVILHIIKEAVLKKIPVIGYNRFFYESGAAVSFIFDYEDLGEQTAKLAIDMLHRNICSEDTPIFHVWLNSRVFKKLGIQMTDKESFPIEIRP